MTVSDWIALGGLAVTVVLFCVAIVRAHGNKDREFQQKTGETHAAMDVKIKHLQDDYELLHKFKNVMLPDMFERSNGQFVNLLDRVEKDINRRLERIEKHLNGHLK